MTLIPPAGDHSPAPIAMPPNVIDHFYAGGGNIAELRGFTSPIPADGVLRQPEEWLAATTDRAGEPGVGLAHVPDGRLLRDLVVADPVGWVGTAAGPGRPAGDTGLLVKLLDAGQRLPVHVHPDRAFARTHLNCPYGKTEAWFVLATSGDQPSVWVGWTEDVGPAEVQARVDAQDSDWMLSRMHRIVVRPGDGILVPAGTVHAIGEGVFVAEVQEPTDFSILLEWSVTTATREESHLGLGFDVVMGAVSHRRLTAEQVSGLMVHTDPADRADRAVRLLPAAADPFFRLDSLAPQSLPLSMPAGFAVLVILDGEGEMTGAAGSAVLPVRRGQVFAVPHAFGDWSVTSGPARGLRALACRPGQDWPADPDGPGDAR